MSLESIFKKIEKNPESFKSMRQTEIICLAVVKKHYFMLEYVVNQTEPVCLAAIKECGVALSYVREQTWNICLKAVKVNGMALLYVREYFGAQDHTLLCIAAVQQNGLALMYVKEELVLEYDYICLEAVKQNPYAIHIISKTIEPPKETYLTALKIDPAVIQTLSPRSKKICIEAIRD